MKIIVTESQIIKLLREDDERPIPKKYETYVDKILDKLSAHGKESLSPEELEDLMKISRGEELEDPESTQDADNEDIPVTHYDDVPEAPSNHHNLFMEIVPDFTQIMVDGEPWGVRKETEPDGGFDVLLVYDVNDSARNSIIINPFAPSGGFEVVYGDKLFKLQTIEDPQSVDKMKIFVDRFIKNELPGIIKKVTKKQ